MSLLDDVSIVVTPNGYKAGELYAVIPVPTEGFEEVTNGDFATDSDWDKTGTWSIESNYATASGNSSSQYIQQDFTITNGKTYLFTYEIIENTLNGVGSALSGSGGFVQIFLSNVIGTHQVYITADDSGAAYALKIGVSATATTGTITLDNVSVKEALTVSADMDVTRATAATRVDENGLVNYAEIVTGSDIVTNGDFSNGSTGWTLQNGWALGSNDVVFTPSASAYRKLYQDSFLTIGKHYKLSFEIKSISAGSIANFEANSPSFNTVGVKTQVFTATYVALYLEPTNDASLTIDNISVKEVTRDNVPRIDYTGGGCPHILAEPQSTNLVTSSEDFTDSSWTKLGAGTGSTSVVTSNYAISPDGTQNATRLVCDLNGGTTTSDQSIIYDLDSSNTSQSISIYIKSNTGLNQNIYFANTYGTGDTAIVTSEWQRFEFNHSTSNHTFSLGLRGDTGADDTADILIWGAQAESNSYATSLIPTSGSTVTRNQDIFTRDGIGSLINSTEGVLFLESESLADDEDTRISISDGTGNNYISIGYSRFSGNIIAEIFAGGVLQTVGWGATGVNKLIYHKFALSWGSGTMNFYMDGNISNTESVTSPTGMNVLKLSSSTAAHTFFGKVKQLQVYDTALTDEQLLQLTGESGTDFYESYAEMASALTYTIQ